MSDFVSFARAHGLRLDYAIADGRWHRTATEDKPKRRNGAYLFDGQRGVVKNFATMQDYASYKDGANAGPIDKAALRARRAIADAETKAKQDEARKTAENMLLRASLKPHPYLVSKGFPLELGLVLDEELLVPMREFSRYAQLNSVQRISADGSKLFLAGGRAKSSVFFIGSALAREQWLVEGYATGLSVRAALKDLRRDGRVIVCFSASNLAQIGRVVSATSRASYVIADHDTSGAGEEAAEATGLPWGMPGDVDTDANDLHQRQGIRALVELMRDVIAVRQKVVAA